MKERAHYHSTKEKKMNIRRYLKKNTVYKVIGCGSGVTGYICANNMIFLIEAQPNMPWTHQLVTLYILTVILYSIMAFCCIKLDSF